MEVILPFNASRQSGWPIDCTNRSERSGPIFTPVGSFVVTCFVVYGIPVVALFGIIGNIISFVLLKESALRISSHFYLICLAIFDTLSLITFIPSFWLILTVLPYYNYLYPGEVNWIHRYFMVWGACQFRMYISFFFRTLSIWTIVLFTMERLISIAFPLRGQAWCTTKAAAIAIGVMSCVAAAINIPWLFAFDKFPVPCSGGRISCKGNKILFVNRFIEFSFLSIIPAVIIFICNGVIIFKLKQRAGLSTLFDKSAALKQQRVITTRLLAVSTAFFLLTFPSLVIISFHTVNELRHDRSHRSGILADVFHIAMFFFCLNLAINFVLYCLTGPTFRRASMALMCCNIKQMRRFRRALNASHVSEGVTASTEMGRRDSNKSETREALLRRTSSSQPVRQKDRMDEKNGPKSPIELEPPAVELPTAMKRMETSF